MKWESKKVSDLAVGVSDFLVLQQVEGGVGLDLACKNNKEGKCHDLPKYNDSLLYIFELGKT